MPFGPTWAIYPPGKESIPELLITTPAGGILGGDRYDIDVSLGPGAAASVLTTEATKVYRRPDSCQSAFFRVDEGATLLCWEAYSAGRVGRGERFAFSTLTSRTRIFRDGVPEVVDGFELSGGGEPFGGYPYTATVYACGPHSFEAPAEKLHALLSGLPGTLASSRGSLHESG